MEGLFDRVRNFFRSMVNILPLKGNTNTKILDSHGLIDESLYQGHEEPKIIVREPTEPTKTALTELE